MENSMEVPQKTKSRTTIWSSNSTPVCISGKNENTNLKRYMHPSIHSSTNYNYQDMEATQMPINRWMDKEIVACVCVCIYIYIYSAIKKWNLAICNNMDGPRGYYAKWNTSDRERQILYDFTYMWNLKKQNKWANMTKQKQSYRHWGSWQTGGQWWKERNRWRRFRGTNFQLQNKCITGMECTVWRK